MPPTAHEVLSVVFRVDGGSVSVLLWQRALEPAAGAWALPGGPLGPDEDLPTSARRLLADKVDLTDVAHLEQFAEFSEPHRIPPSDSASRTIASVFLGLVRAGTEPRLPEDTAWHSVDDLPNTAFDHGVMVHRARARLAARLSYTNIGFALAPREFPVSELRDIYVAVLGYPVDATNLLRILSRRSVITATGTTARSGRSGGRPPALYRFQDTYLRVTDEFATLRPPG
ncbi:NUDIX domain-containing protein [Tsukamurella sp. 8F]|uniref:NUDIX hydrolase n=1 Tax=unclassified Tsukamurella TaxID=2633480 RepID=UPI0023B9D5EE|nr:MULTISPECIES: NUDIX domain-containing protein [unclassified Tsukamurella]MDF0529207.1 NUDIX domain-containing protein [Tsukamurella sp. 8J]MDF0585392.1 NUDIX domain-containing protein [Tsukamurella sp. 8F]